MEKDKKYELLPAGADSFRIRALKDFTCQGRKIHAGDEGGTVSSESNLSQEGTCWIFDRASVTEKAILSDSAVALGNAKIFGSAHVFGEACVKDEAQVSENAKMCGSAVACDRAKIKGNSMVCGEATCSDASEVSGNAVIMDRALLCGAAKAAGEAFIVQNARLEKNAAVLGFGFIGGSVVLGMNELLARGRKGVSKEEEMIPNEPEQEEMILPDATADSFSDDLEEPAEAEFSEKDYKRNR